MKKILSLVLLFTGTWTLCPAGRDATSTNPYDVGVDQSEFRVYRTDGHEERDRLSDKYNSLAHLSKKELQEYLAQKILHRTYTKRVKNSTRDLEEDIEFSAVPASIGASLAAIALHFARLQLTKKQPTFKHVGTVLCGTGGLLGGLATSYYFAFKKKNLLHDTKKIISLLQLDDQVLYQLINNRQKSLSLSAIGLPHPFVDDGTRLDVPADAAEVITNFSKQLEKTTPQEGANGLRKKLMSLISSRIKQLKIIHKTLLPISIALWTSFGINLWAYPSTLLAKEQNIVIKDT